MTSIEHVGLSTDHLDYLQRRGWAVRPVPVGGPATTAPRDRRRLTRIDGVGRFVSELGGGLREPAASGQGYRPTSEDLLIGLSGYSIPLAFLLTGDRGRIGLHLGTWSPVERERVGPDVLDRRQTVLATVLEGVYPALDLVACAPAPTALTHGGLVLGVPCTKPPDQRDPVLPLDRLIRSLHDSSFAALVLADPVDELAVAQLRHGLLNELRAAAAAGQATLAPSPLAEAYSELLTCALTALATGEATGAWRTGVYLLGDAQSYFRLASVWRSIFSGDESRPEPVRVWDDPAVVELARRWALPDLPGGPGPGLYQHPFHYQTLLTSAQLAAYIHLPANETIGYRVRDIPRFDVSPPALPDGPGIAVGQVIEDGRPVPATYQIRPDDLTRHALVAGVTGSGKTNTMFHLLGQVWRTGIPFLVLEPAKTEYRSLIAAPEIGPELRVFTLGEERVSPLRINPFEVRTGVSVATHIDLLKSLFNASFGMWQPLPQVLERCIHAVYRDYGWDTIRNVNRRNLTAAGNQRAFPTVTDLHDKVQEVVDALGYEERIASDIKAALMTRLHSLRIGGKGLMLDTQRSVPFELLLQRPTIIELEPVGDDDEKAFLMGLLLMRLYEHHRATGSTEGTGLAHVVVVEEAHRLLANVPPASREEGNVRGKAVETFTNMLSEVRAYGQAFLVAEQIPTKLAPDVIKNTNLKIVHRVVAGDDRRVLAAAMNVDEQQSDMLAVLDRGEAVVFAEGDDRPILVTVPYAKIRVPPAMQTKEGSDRVVTEHLRPLRQELPANLFVPFELCPARCRAPYAYCEPARSIVDRTGFREQLAALVLALVLPGGQVAERAGQLAELIRRHLPAELTDEALPCILMNGASWYWAEFGRRYGWPYDTSEVEQRLTSILLALLPPGDGHTPAAPTAEIDEFAATYRRLCHRTDDPFPTCRQLCPDGSCLFRYHAQRLLGDTQLGAAFDLAMNAAKAGDWTDFTPIDDVIARLVGAGPDPAVQRAAGLCYGVQQIASTKGLSAAGYHLATGRLLNGFDAR